MLWGSLIPTLAKLPPLLASIAMQPDLSGLVAVPTLLQRRKWLFSVHFAWEQ